MPAQSLARALLTRIRALRENAGITEAKLEEALVLGPGWIGRFEAGEVIPSIDMFAAILHSLGRNFADVIADWAPEEPTAAIEREIRAETQGSDLLVSFRYAEHDAQYLIPNGTIEQFTEVLRTLRNGLAGSDEDSAMISEAVAKAYLAALRAWPHANPSDIWYFILLRAFCDPYNHEARFARKDFQQSWKRTGGWALEKVFVAFYKDALKARGINILTGTKEQKAAIIKELGLKDRLEADKVDILLTGDTKQGEEFFGVVHVKASFAERRTDDVPMSRVLIDAGFTSPLLTMDCKASPGSKPTNRGELGQPLAGHGADHRSAKRKDMEDDRLFSACFSYNSNTIPTPPAQEAAARIYTLDFSNPADAFASFVAAEWARIRKNYSA